MFDSSGDDVDETVFWRKNTPNGSSSFDTAWAREMSPAYYKYYCKNNTTQISSKLSPKAPVQLHKGQHHLGSW